MLAGGAGRRMGGGKPARRLAGRPLIEYPVSVLGEGCERVVVVAKRDTELPPLPTERWHEPDEPQHPRTGIVAALERAGQPVLVCAADMPFVTPEAFRTLLGSAAGAGATRAAVAISGGVLQPLLGVYAPAALATLRDAPSDAPLTDSIEALDPVRVALPAAVVRSIDTPDELEQAERELGGA